MLRIDHLRIRLPADYQHRAKAILGHIAEQLGGTGFADAGRRDRVSVGPLTFEHGLSDRQIAARVCEGIRRSLEQIE